MKSTTQVLGNALFALCAASAAASAGDTCSAPPAQHKYRPEGAGHGSRVGKSLSVDADLALVGASGYTPWGGGTGEGAAFVYELIAEGPGGWQELTMLTAGDGSGGDNFGSAVCLQGDTAVIGAPGDTDFATEPGAVYVLSRHLGGPDNWGEVKMLRPSEAASTSDFGISVSLSGDTLVVGAPRDGAGSAWVFERNEGGPDNWGEVAKLTAGDATPFSQYGCSVAIDGDTIVVGRRSDPSLGLHSGSVYVHVRDHGGAGQWGELTKITGSDTTEGDQFGLPVSIDGDTVVVGAHREDSACPSDPNCNSGAAYVFERDEGGADQWGEVAKLTPAGAANRDYFGSSVAVRGDEIAVGASQANTGGEGFASLFVLNQGVWVEVEQVASTDTEIGQEFGASVALGNQLLLAGAPSDDEGSSSEGAFYAVELADGVPSSQVVRLGVPANPAALLPGVTSGPAIGATWDPVIDHTSFLPSATFDFLMVSQASTNIDVPPYGTLLCLPPTVVPPAITAPGVPFALPVPDNCNLVGLTFAAQAGSISAGETLLTNALDIEIGTY